MRYLLSTFLLFFCLASLAQRANTALTNPNKKTGKSTLNDGFSKGKTGFVENKGQIMDQFGALNSKVLFLLNTEGLNVQLRQDGFSYDTYQVLPGTKELSPKSAKFDPSKTQRRITNFHRVDVSFEGIANSHLISPLNKNSDEIRYSGVGEIITHHFKEVVYQDLYPNIDLRFYLTDLGKFEYDFVVRAGADPSMIKLSYNGQNSISLNSRNEISLKVAHGEMTEHMPVSYVRETSQRVDVSYRQISGNVFQFSVPEFDKTKTLIIDPTPTLAWATYFGGSDEDSGESITADNNDNVYVAGYTYSPNSIATFGSFQNFIAGSADGYFVKFNSSGVRQFSTYVGGPADDFILGILVSSGDIFVTGYTASTTGIATSGVQQTVNSGGYDAFLMKFNNLGARLWGTYYGGTLDDFAFDITMNPAGQPIIAGRTASTNLAILSGAAQSSYGGGANDAYYAVFNSTNGVLVRSSFLGGADNDGAVKVISDASGNIFVTGWTNSSTGIATSGTFSSTQNGLYDAFLAKYSSAGAKSWTTYFGGSDEDEGYGITLDGNGWPYITGYTKSSGINVGGSNPGTYSGGQDIIVAKFNTSNGAGIWSSYYGGSGDETAWSLVADNTSIYGCGETSSTSGIASSGAYQTAHGGGTYDALFFKINLIDGSKEYGSYYGNTGEEYAKYNAIDATGNVLFSGLTDSPSGMASGSSHQSTYGGGAYDAFVAKFGTASTLASEPTAQPTNLTFSNVASTSLTGNFQAAAGNPVGYLILFSANVPPDIDPVDGEEYTYNQLVGTVSGNDVYNLGQGSATGFSVVSISLGTTLYFKVFSYNGSGTSINYLQVSPLEGNVTTLGSPEPTAQPTNLVISNPTSTSFDYEFTAATGSPAGYIVLRSAGAAVTGAPLDGTEYFPGDPLGNAFVRSTTAVGGTLYTASSLLPATTYHTAIYAYNGSGIAINYRQVSPLTGSIATLGLLASEPTAQPTNLVVTDGPTFDSFTYDITPVSSGVTGYLHIYKIGSAPTALPEDGKEYSTDDVLSDGSIVRFSDNFPTGNFYEGLTQGTSYFIQIFSYNGDGSERNYLTTNPLSATITTLSPDTTPPNITNNTVSTVKAGEAVKVSVTATDAETGVDAVDIIYRASSEIDTKSASMDNTSGDIWEFTIPSSEVKDLGVEYIVFAYNGVGGQRDTGIQGVTITTNDENGLTLPSIPAGTTQSSYRIISVPLSLTSKTVTAVFGDDLGVVDKTKWRMFRYSGGQTNELSGGSSINPGEGYWLISSVAASLDTGPGATVGRISAPVTINVTQGYNQIGNPYVFNLLWSDVTAYDDGTFTNTPLGLGPLKTYNGSFSESTTLRKYEGGFVLATTSGTLAFPAERNPSAGRTEEQPVVAMHNSIDGEDWEVAFELSNGTQTMNFSGLGMNRKASDGYDGYDDFTLPRFIDYIELNHASKELFNLWYTKDIVPSWENHTWEFSVETSTNEHITLKWDNSFFGTNSKQLVLWDVNMQRGLDMRKEDQVVFSKSRSGHFKVFYGDEQYVKEKTAIDQVIFHDLFPNPAREMVTISFSVPGEERVTIEVIDLMGRKMATVADGNFKPGYHEVSWNTREMTNGIYITQIKSLNRDQQKRLSINK